MDRDILLHLPVLAAVARLRSFARAASELGMSPSAVSHSVRLVEERIGMPLFARTTRSVSLTESGERFLARAVPALAEISEAIASSQASRGMITGTLRINAPNLALHMVLTDLIAAISARHPDLVVEVTTDEGLSDIVAEGFDVGIRLGEMIAEDMVAVRLTPPFQAILVAAPEYLSRVGTPESLADLHKHNCINYHRKTAGGTYAWDMHDGTSEVRLAVAGTVSVSESMFAIELALASVGIAYVFEPLVRKYLRDQRLRQLLPEAAVEEAGLFLYFPRRSAQAPKLRVLIDEARKIAHRPPG
jgi:DNA-binding transcriptional LysR family regulator